MEAKRRAVLNKKVNKQSAIIKHKMKKSKIELETLGKILLLTAFLIMFLLMFKGCQDQMKNVGVVGMNEYTCWLSKTMKAQLSFIFPSTCSVIDVKDEQDKAGIASLIRKCWWMHGQGEADISETFSEKYNWFYDQSRTCYVFTPKEDILWKDLEIYLRSYGKSGEKKQEDSQETTWGYVQRKTTAQGICFDRGMEDKLIKGKRYFIIFYDERAAFKTGDEDRIMISRDPDFGVKQTGDLEGMRNALYGEVTHWCKSWKVVLEESEKENTAMTLFDNLINSLKECSKITGRDSCYCGQKIEITPEGYSIKIEKLSEKKYKVSLLKGRETFEKNGKKFEEEIDARIGFWDDRINERLTSKNSCTPGVIGTTPKISLLVNYYATYHPNKDLGIKDCQNNEMIYLTTQANKMARGLRKCS